VRVVVVDVVLQAHVRDPEEKRTPEREHVTDQPVLALKVAGKSSTGSIL
jgi:hypothetical protein